MSVYKELKVVASIAMLLIPIVSKSENSWIGNGSVMSAYENIVSDSDHPGPYPFGVTTDTTNLHNMSNNNVGFFQWFVTPSSCERLKVTSSSKSKVNITVGTWSSRSLDRTFRNIKLPFVIGDGNVKNSGWFNGRWLVVAIKFSDKSENDQRLDAKCTTEKETNASYEQYATQIKLGQYIWSGNASIMSGYFEKQFSDLDNPSYGQNPAGQWPYGIFKDVSRFSPKYKKQVVFFQWLKSSVCNNLKLDILGAPEYKKDVKIISKGWNVSPSQVKTEKATLPYTTNTNNLWTVLGVYSDTKFENWHKVEAKCTNETIELLEREFFSIDSDKMLKRYENSLVYYNKNKDEYDNKARRFFRWVLKGGTLFDDNALGNISTAFFSVGWSKANQALNNFLNGKGNNIEIDIEETLNEGGAMKRTYSKIIDQINLGRKNGVVRVEQGDEGSGGDWGSDDLTLGVGDWTITIPNGTIGMDENFAYGTLKIHWEMDENNDVALYLNDIYSFDISDYSSKRATIPLYKNANDLVLSGKASDFYFTGRTKKIRLETIKARAN